MNVLPSEKPKISGLNSTICKCMEITVTSQNDATKDKHGAQLGKKSRCGNFRNFLPLRFYVKTIFENLEVLKVPFLSFLGAVKFVDLVYFSLQKVQKFIKIKTQI